MLFVLYQLLVALVALLVAGVVLRSRSRAEQATGALVLVPLLLRLFLVK
jgi:hypothetical protein